MKLFALLALLCLATTQGTSMRGDGDSLGTVDRGDVGEAEAASCTANSLTDCQVKSKCEAAESFVHNLANLDDPTSLLSVTCWCATGAQTGCILELAHGCTSSAVGCRCGDSAGTLENF